MSLYHFLPSDRRLNHGDGRRVQLGKRYAVTGNLIACNNAMHAGRRVIDALEYAPGPILCHVELGPNVRWKHCGNIAYARWRRVVRWQDVTNILHEFACRCAKDALVLVGNCDPRSAAWVVARVAARDAAWDAARGAARGAAWDAARVAARDAAWAKQNRRLTAMVARNWDKDR